MVRSTTGMDGVGDLLPLNFRKSLLIAQGLGKVVRIDAIEVLLNKHLEKVELRACQQ